MGSRVEADLARFLCRSVGRLSVSTRHVVWVDRWRHSAVGCFPLRRRRLDPLTNQKCFLQIQGHKYVVDVVKVGWQIKCGVDVGIICYHLLLQGKIEEKTPKVVYLLTFLKRRFTHNHLSSHNYILLGKLPATEGGIKSSLPLTLDLHALIPGIPGVPLFPGFPGLPFGPMIPNPRNCHLPLSASTASDISYLPVLVVQVDPEVQANLNDLQTPYT